MELPDDQHPTRLSRHRPHARPGKFPGRYPLGDVMESLFADSVAVSVGVGHCPPMSYLSQCGDSRSSRDSRVSHVAGVPCAYTEAVVEKIARLTADPVSRATHSAPTYQPGGK